MPRNERPLDPGDTPLLRFAAGLRRLRESAGGPVYRELSVKAHYSVAVLSEAAGGRKLPSLAVTLAYVDACGGDLAEWERTWRDVAEAQEAPAEPDSGEPPYLGLSAFQIEDATRFHGRGALLAHLSNQILNRRLVVVFGASGAGKSSLLRAGLAAASLRDGVDGLGSQPTVVFAPGAHPIDECALGLAGPTGTSPSELRAELRADPAALHLRLRQAMEREEAVRDALIVVDQFEEVFTLCVDEDERLAFITALLHVAAAPSGRARLVLGVRADFFGHCLQYPQLRQVLGEGPVLVGAMTADELRLAITKPAIDLGYTVETALVTRLVSEATNQPGVLPLLSHALLETWRRRQGITLTAAGYDAAGGISHALNRTAESVYSGLTDEQQTVARQVFLRLTALGDGTEDTRRRVDRSELDHVNGLDEVLDALVAARLVTVDRESVDIAHEALISHWPRLREWLTEDRDSLRAHRQLTEAAEIWDGLNRDDGALYRGARLQLARDWVRSCTPSLSHREQAFFDRSVDVREQEQLAAKRQTRRQRRLMALLVVLLLALSGTTAYSLISQQTIAQQRDDATIRNVIDKIPAVATDNQPLADELALALYRYAPSDRTRGLLLSTSVNSTRVGVGRSDERFDPGNALSADASHYVFAADDGTVVLQELGPGGTTVRSQLPMPPGIVGAVAAVTVATDVRHVAVVYKESTNAETVALWDVADVGHPKVLRTYKTDNEVHAMFSPDGRLLAIGSIEGPGIDHGPGDLTVLVPADRDTRLWDVTNPVADAPLAQLPVSAMEMQFSADGGSLLTGMVTSPTVHKNGGGMVIGIGPAEIWDVKQALQGKPPTPAVIDTAQEAGATALSADGRLIAVARGGNSVALWRHDPPGAPVKIGDITVGTDPLQPAFSPDGRYLALEDLAGTVKVWDVSDSTRPALAATVSRAGAGLLRFTTDNRLAIVGNGAVTTMGMDVDVAAKKVCAEVRYAPIARSLWNWDSYFPAMSVPEPCPT
ncbi:nSTAND1 domain-containing NTPase [Kutzneria chonburiensis]|uniref:XRE family transcriptional regulator n=1 Tax=Kutzneria chonburiensis TaxID=1483604 RepID=A0ABV6MTB4_9PSEU